MAQQLVTYNLLHYYGLLARDCKDAQMLLGLLAEGDPKVSFFFFNISTALYIYAAPDEDERTRLNDLLTTYCPGLLTRDCNDAAMLLGLLADEDPRVRGF